MKYHKNVNSRQKIIPIETSNYNNKGNIENKTYT